MEKKLFETITISIGKRCPQKCSFCYHNAGENGYLFNDEIVNLENFIFKIGITPKEIILAGNDPLLYLPTTSQVISLIRSRYNDTKIKILTNLISFRWLLSKYSKLKNRDEVFNSACNKVFSADIAVTIDSRAPPPEDILPETLYPKTNIVNTMFTFSSSNESTPADFIINWTKKLGCNVVRINLDFSSKDKIKDPYELARVVSMFIKKGAGNGIFVLGDWDSILINMIEGKEGHYCGRGSAYLTSTSVLACAYLKHIKQDNNLVFSEGAGAAATNLENAMETFRIKMSKERGCVSCHLQKWCNGGCLAVDTNLFCNFMREIVSIFEKDMEFKSLYIPQETEVVLND